MKCQPCIPLYYPLRHTHSEVSLLYTPLSPSPTHTAMCHPCIRLYCPLPHTQSCVIPVYPSTTLSDTHSHVSSLYTPLLPSPIHTVMCHPCIPLYYPLRLHNTRHRNKTEMLGHQRDKCSPSAENTRQDYMAQANIEKVSDANTSEYRESVRHQRLTK